MRIEASGEVNLLANTVELLFQLVSLHGVTSTLEWVSLVGDLPALGRTKLLVDKYPTLLWEMSNSFWTEGVGFFKKFNATICTSLGTCLAVYTPAS